MKKIILPIAMLLCYSIEAQDLYYYNGDEKVTVFESKQAFISYERVSDLKNMGFEKIAANSVNDFSILERPKNPTSLEKMKSVGSGQTMPALLLEPSGKVKLFPTRTLRIKLKKGKKYKDILNFIDPSAIVSHVEKHGIHELEVRHFAKCLDMANTIYESGIAKFSHPDFYIPMEGYQIIPIATEDPLYPLQYQMHNTGQIIDGVAGISDMDCNAPEAWQLARGEGVTIAVFDGGLEAHSEFGNRLVAGTTPALTNNSNGAPIRGSQYEHHGMAVGGIVAAAHGNGGIKGMAPSSTLLSVNTLGVFTTVGQVADGIHWAMDRGARVMVNSWGYGPIPPVDEIEAAIEEATSEGAVFVFASGNYEDDVVNKAVSYPASNPNVIAVGAFDNRGIHHNYSGSGPELDLTAPSGDDSFGNVRTLDREGDPGLSNGDYRSDFGGTSAACPVVAGVAALVLSVNPDLTPAEVRSILTETATPMGGSTFNYNFGHGRVNAIAAVELAIERCKVPDLTDAQINTGGNMNQYAQYQFTVTGDKYSTSFEWTVPSGWSISASGDGRLAYITPNSTGNHTIYARAINNCGFDYISTQVCVSGSGYSCSSGGGGGGPCVGCVVDGPNPLGRIGDELRVYANSDKNLILQGVPASASVQVFNLSGQLLLQRTTQEDNFEIIETRNLVDQILILSISHEDVTFKQKLYIEN